MVTQYLAGLRLLVIRFISCLLEVAPLPLQSVHGHRFWFDPKSSRLFPAMAGASPDDGDEDGDGGDDADADADGDKGAAGDGGGDDADADDDDDDDADRKREPNWKRLSRKHEREAKKAREERDEAKRKLQEQEDAKKTDQQKAVDEAAKTAREEAEREFEKERRNDRLENAAIRAGAKGVTVKVGKGKDAEEKIVKLEDPDDALVFLKRDIEKGELDWDDLFKENGSVDREKLEEALADLYERKPKLFTDGKSGGGKKVEGGADGGKGGGDVKTDDEASVDDIAKSIRRSRPPESKS